MQISRREFGSVATGIALGAVPGLNHALQAQDDENPMPIVDTHTHFYDTARPLGVPWPAKDDKLLYRPVLPDEFEKLTRPLGVVGTVVVEASSWLEDNQWLLDLAEKNSVVLGIVGHLTPGTDSFANELARFSKNPRFRGIRVNAGELDHGLSRPEYRKDLGRMIGANLELDVNGGPEMLAIVDRLARQLPDLRIVVNHLANTKIDGRRPPAAWIDGVRSCGTHGRVYMKVSALVENGRVEGKAPADTSFYRPVLQEVWKAFGEDRLMFGSDWPVSDVGGPYPLIVQIVKDFWKDLGQAAARKFFYENAQAAYQWPKR